jgi:glutamate synthase (NADPH/NADH) small chain
MVSGEDGKVHQVHCARVQWEQDKATGQFAMKEVPRSEFTLQVDLILLAMGFVHVEHGRLVKELGVRLDPRGNIAVDSGFATSVKNVFAAGDTVRGASLVVWAIRQGREAAAAIHSCLKS